MPMLSLRQSLALVGKPPPTGIRDKLLCKSLRDSLLAWNHTPYDLLIIAPQEFIEGVKPLAEYKNKTGIATMLLSLEHIYQAYQGKDEAEQVKRCLAMFQPNNGVRYAMLVGDLNKFPVRYVKEYCSDNATGNAIFLPADLYYETLFNPDGSFNDWDGNQDGYFGEIPDWNSTGPVNPDRVSLTPYLAVGRIPASKVDEVERYVQKVMRYEKSAFGSSWERSALFIATTDWAIGACMTLEEIATNYLNSFDPSATATYNPTVHRLYGQDSKGEYPCQPTDPLNPNFINQYIDQGVGFVAYLGHGNYDSWGTPDDYGINSNPAVSDLTNTTELPVVIAAACLTGEFTGPDPAPEEGYLDVNGVPHTGTNNGEVFQSTPPQPACVQTQDTPVSMAEQMTVMQDTGAIAYAGSTIISGGDFELLEPFFETATTSNTLGDMWLHMLVSYYTNKRVPPPWNTAMNSPWGPDGATGERAYGPIVNPWFFHLFGDPSLRIQGIS
jgi:hypothetical protein